MENLTDFQQAALTAIGLSSKGNEVTGRTIAQYIGLPPRPTGKEGADMRAIINALRRKGYPVCANGKGYYYPQSTAEIKQYMESLSGRIHKAQEALDGMKAALPVWESQGPKIIPQGPSSQPIIEI